ncbi:anthranilate synthase component 1 [Corynebacterium spheniscorum]|uniref:anthranilate synthase component 1 n=1 Tax=Corynebacterium spheniscorum TaxID=185761 RepID=UPI000B856ADF|nr:anthranilate synthase component 1 [Corynebacterium spheniscorum]
MRYHENASGLFALLGGTQARDAVLLESADITTHSGLTSVMVLRGSLRVTCVEQEVRLEVLSPSGELLASRVREQLAEFLVEQGSGTPAGVFRFLSPDELAKQQQARGVMMEERERLLAPSPALVLRKLQMDPGYEDPSGTLPFLAGGFAFDYLGTFETLSPFNEQRSRVGEDAEGAEGAEAERVAIEEIGNTYPDYQFIAAEIMLTINHEEATAELVALDVGDSAELQAELDRLAEIIEHANTADAEDAAGAEANVSRETLARRDAAEPGTLPVSVDVSDAEFRDLVTQMKQEIYNGEIYQVVPARTFSAPCPDAFAAYRQLRDTNPSPYMFYLRGVDQCGEPYELFGASPESNLKFDAETREVQLYPIAGTRPRGLTPTGEVDLELDIRAELELRTDDKEIAEHTMLVDLARNDLARVAVPRTRAVAELLQVDRYSRVMHLISRVTATLDPEFDALDAYRACMNMGTLTGAPKLRATDLLRRAEGKRRGSYGGAVGYLRGDGDMDTCIVIRSAYVRRGVAMVQAGAGVVRDSQPQAEADETLHKAYAVLRALALADNGKEPEVQR